ncbi:MAG: MBOAT family protein [Treponema sp.]|nr:MBOAT family protein [Treponema sp.]
MAFLSIEFGVFVLLVAGASFFVEKICDAENFAGRVLLFVASLVFYVCADIRFLPFIVYVSLVSYASGFFLDSASRKPVLFLFVLLEIIPLLFFKYAPFLSGILLKKSISVFFPLGISFFTFQALSYTIDVFMGKVEREKSLVTVALFVGFFPFVTSGPIQKAHNLIPELKKKRAFSYGNMTCGLKLFAFGAAKKLLVANALALYVDSVYASIAQSHGCALFLASILYSFQIYFDFSGYSDMAIGIARFFSFDVERNFDHPYLSQSIGEFWRRWHISLSSWLRDYVYFPLGGSRGSKLRCCLNLLVVFLVSGIWHGAHLNFVFWGLLHGVFQCAERLLKPVREKIGAPSWVHVLVTFVLVSFAWIFFRIERFDDAFFLVRKICAVPQEILQLVSAESVWAAKDLFKEFFGIDSAAVGFLAGFSKMVLFLGLFVAVDVATKDRDGLEIVGTKPLLVRWGLYALLLWTLCYLMLFRGGDALSANFIYNNF